MKKIMLSAAAAVVLLASCGKSEVCGCVDSGIEKRKAQVAAKEDQAKLKEIDAKYKSDEEKCKKVFESKKSDEEMKKLDEEIKKCDGYAEMEKMMKEGMK